MLNRITLVGRMTRDAENKFTPSGKAVCNFSIAVNRMTKGDDGKNDVDFFDITAWGKTAEFVAQYLGKGRLVSVDGRLQTRSYVAQDGSNRKVYEIVADQINGLDKGKDDGDHVAAPAAAPAPRKAAVAKAAPVEDDDDSDPFADE